MKRLLEGSIVHFLLFCQFSIIHCQLFIFMQLSNYHSHCNFCDGRSYPEDFVKFAIRYGFRAYGFSSHSPLPFETSWNMSKEDMDEYLSEIARLKKKYAEQLEIYVGLEIDYLDLSYNASIPYFRELPLDYRIGSVHFLPVSYPLIEANMMCIDGSFSDFSQGVDRYYGGNIRRLVEHYYHSSCDMVETGDIDIVGHLDKIYMNSQRYTGFSLEADWYRDTFCAYLDLIAEKGLIVEVNTKNYTRKQELYPHVQFLSEVLKRRIPVIVNSDCHYPDLVNDGRESAFCILKEKGFRATCELVQGQWKEMPL